jgi:hypothetical protein
VLADVAAGKLHRRAESLAPRVPLADGRAGVRAVRLVGAAGGDRGDGEPAVRPGGQDAVGLPSDRRSGVALELAKVPGQRAGLDQVPDAGGDAAPVGQLLTHA